MASQDKAPPSTESDVLDGRAKQVSDGGVEAPKTAQPVVVFQDFPESPKRQLRAFPFFGVPNSSNIGGLFDFRRDRPRSSRRIPVTGC